MKKISCKFKLFIIFIVLLACANNSFSMKYDEDNFTFFEWDNPIPKFTDLGLDLNEVTSVIWPMERIGFIEVMPSEEDESIITPWRE